MLYKIALISISFTFANGFECPAQGGGYLFKDPTDCSKYYKCDYNRNPPQANLFSCPGNTLFNPMTNYCDWDYNLSPLRATECSITKDSDDPRCDGTNGMPFSIGECKSYGVCGQNGQVEIRNCPVSPDPNRDLVFNPERKYCDWFDLVANQDGDDFPDHCDVCPNDASNTDPDQDGVCGNADNCPNNSNPNQEDSDGDGLGDVCDPCPNDPGNSDPDNDGVCGNVDNCPNTFNPSQVDSDNDGLGDSCDECPNDATNTCNDSFCGDGVLDRDNGEFCDDGNNNNGDGCNSNCICESPYNIQFINVNGGNTPYDDTFENAKRRWECVIVGDVPDISGSSAPPNWFWNPAWGVWPYPVVVTGPIDDIVIGYSIEFIDGVGSILGSAGMRYFRNAGGLPISGFMRFDSADIANMDNIGILDGVILHEVGHILGLVGVGSQSALTPGCTPGGNNGFWAGPAANAAYTALGFFGSLSVETDGGPGTSCSHWNEVDDADGFGLYSELMTGFATGSLSMSLITIEALRDIGYQVDTSQADPFGPGNVASIVDHVCVTQCQADNIDDPIGFNLCIQLCYNDDQIVLDPNGNPYTFGNDIDNEFDISENGIDCQ